MYANEKRLFGVGGCENSLPASGMRNGVIIRVPVNGSSSNSLVV